MIVVIGSPCGRRDGDDVRAGGLAASVAIVAATLGRVVQLVGRIGDDPVADAVLRDLAVHGVGHVAVMRDAAHPTPLWTEGGDVVTGQLELDAEDVGLALRYLTDFAVVAIVGAPGSVLSVADRAASWGAAKLVMIADTRAHVGGAGPEPAEAVTATRLTPAAGESVAAFAARVGEHLVALDMDAEAVRSAR